MLQATAAPVSATGTGNFTATPLKPSDSWNVSTQTGDFAWSYPLRTPPAAAGPAPALALDYDSQAVDGESGSTNNQPGSVGESWSLSGGGFIERSYTPCSDDSGPSGPVATSGDLCWQSDNATISFDGHSGQLVKDTATGTWVMQADDGSRIEHLVGQAAGCGPSNGTYDDDCWKVTTTDGTQYFFGLNQLPGWSSGNAATNSAWTVPVYGNDAGEPCHASTFATSSCTQAWRWNLDYILDPDGNAEALYYDAQTNHYSQNGTTAVSYTRGGELDHIDYGIAGNAPYVANAASDRVTFSYAANGRCAAGSGCTSEAASGQIATPATPANYPDVPFDQNCASGACTGLVSPTFFTTSMLASVTTQYFTGSSYANVDAWTLSHSFPSPGDGTNAALWLSQISHTGYTGSASLTEPPTVFSGVPMQNRVWAIDGLAPLMKYRISAIQTGLGESLAVNYTTSSDCTPANAAAIEAAANTNTKLCYPEYWAPGVLPYTTPKLDLFFKYVVTSTLDDPKTGGGNDRPIETDYQYTGTPAWRYNTSPLTPADQRTWNVYAGYNTVEVRVGDSSTPALQQTTDYTYFQGMDGDRASTTGGAKTVDVTGSSTVHDSLWLAGQLREQKSLEGAGGAILSDTVSTPWASAVKADDGTHTARFVEDGVDVTTQPLSAGGNRTITTTNSYDPGNGLITTAEKATSDAGTSCTTTGYTQPNTTAWIIGAIQRVTALAVPCASTATARYPADVLSDTADYYDGASVPATPPTAPAATPSKGHLTATQEVDGYTGTTAATAHWATASTTSYDSLGRPLAVTDVLGHTTSTVYTPAARGPLTSELTTNPLSWTTTTAYNPAWGVETSVTDQNGHLTTAAYDALGRRTGVWTPTASQSAGATASIGYSYTESQTAASTITTVTQSANTSNTTIDLYDGLGRQVQSQASGSQGTVMSDTGYDAAGRVDLQNSPYVTTQANPATALFVPASQQQIPSETDTSYDGAGRTTTTSLYSSGTLRRTTAFTYRGADRTDTTPPAGGTPTTSYTNSLGQQTSLVDYLAASPSPTAPQQTTQYSYDPAGHMTKTVDPAGNTWTWAYDVLGQQITAADPDTGTTTSSYDDAGDLLTSTDGNGTTLSYTYDGLNRKTATYQGTATGSAGTILDSWVYDTLDKGDLTSSTAYTGSTPGSPGLAYKTAVGSYNTLDEQLSSTVSIPAGAPAFGGSSFTTSFAYSADGSLALQTDPAAGSLPSEALHILRDSRDQVTSVRGSVAYGSVNHTGLGQLAGFSHTTGSTYLYTSYGYDPATGDLNALQDEAATGSAATILADRQYTRDASGRITQESNTSAAATDTQCFGYDALSELTAAWSPSSASCTAAPSSTTLGGPAPYWESFTYDTATGNRLSATQHATTASGTDTVAAYRYPAAGAPHPHAVAQIAATGATTSTQPYSYSWDAAGDATQLGALTASYDSQGKTATITSGTSTQTRVYDAGGSLLLQIDPTGSTLFLGDTEVRLAAGAASASASRTYSVEGVPFAERDAAAGATTSSLYWLGVDVDGSPDVEVNSATGQVTKRFTDPFGNTRGTGVSWSSDRGFLNDSSSALSGLTQVGARLYDSATGSFTTADPLLDATSFASLNAYAYAGNDPVTDTDPSGECLQSNGALTQATNCGASKGSATAASATMAADHAQAAYEATPAGQKYLAHYADYLNSPAFAEAVKRLYTLPKAKPGQETWGEQLDLMSANTQMQMLQMNSAAEAAPEDGAAEDLGAEFEGLMADVFSGKSSADLADSGAVPPQLLRGQQFEADTLEELGLTKNTAKVPGGSIPDSVDGGQIWEVKDVKYQAKTHQFRNYLATGKQVNIVVNSNTVVSAPLRQAIARSGGEILVRRGPGAFVPYGE
ncbi:hypothetical protein D7I44_14930 [Gryllotalpicola protaetiae]|uniref:DUF6443 domain-containing protein n=1 Tax=Gryllotalpicola protaetiae TaxID=2419771 RepID=A0A387BUC7_9MICO|nr:hypothetical protein D7I44_14930 [Gryllotalpicola protaetiae]